MYPFHFAFPVTDLEEAKAFYLGTLGCPPGRESPGCWFDFDLFGHQMSAHLAAPETLSAPSSGAVAGDTVPIPHFGVVLDLQAFHALAEKLSADPNTDWILHPKTRMKGEPGEQVTMFVRDPSGNALEFKGFADRAALFAS
jgi:extradiol dioxygenase family protein